MTRPMQGGAGSDTSPAQAYATGSASCETLHHPKPQADQCMHQENKRAVFALDLNPSCSSG